ncbi:MAG: 3-deoxy-manno-octulosonate cytidylyltransferase [Planctomycetota bacterium]|nr:3-deoxy-manno-octulosonate cytidylyltransferase [Planctomycetota bacterium]
MAAVAIIPARFGSTRFPGKIVASSTGKPLVQHVVERARRAKRLRDVIVATDDQRIVDALRPFKTRCVMTSTAHVSGTDRIAEVAKGLSDAILVNVQGDEPEIDAETIDALIDRLESTGDDMATAATPFPDDADANDPNLVKVVIGLDDKALYFSRSPIPFQRDSTQGARATYYLHQGIYAYRRQFLLMVASWPPTPLEQSEKLEQLRVLEHGRPIHIVKTNRVVHGIDTPQQYDAFVKRFKEVAAR